MLEPRQLLAVIEHSGDVADAAVWGGSDVHLLTGDVTVPASAKLTIEPGAVVKLDSGFRDLHVMGQLEALGTAAAPIIFTSDRDDTFGGDTNQDGNSTSPSPGNWGHVNVAGGTADIDHALFRFGGFAGASLTVDAGALTLTNSTIEMSRDDGVRIIGSDPLLENNAFIDIEDSAVSMDLASNPQIVGVTLSGNGINGVAVDSGTLPSDRVWDDPDIVYWIDGDITVPAGRRLDVAAGQIVKISDGFDSFFIEGTLQVQGTSVDPVVFTSELDDSFGGDTTGDGNSSTPDRGDWRNIEVMPGGSATIDHALLRYGGFVDGTLVVDAGELTLTNSTIELSSNDGVRIIGNDPTLSNNIYRDIEDAAISSDLASNPDIVGATFSGNGVNGLQFDSGVLPADTVWDDPDIVYWIDGDITVPAGTRLEVVAGQIVKFVDSFSDLFVDGTIEARGTAAAPVIFTISTDDASGGDTNNDGPGSDRLFDRWGGIVATGPGNALEYVQLRRGGFREAALEIDGGGVTAANLLIHDPFEHGVYAHDGATLELTNSIVYGSPHSGVLIESGSQAMLTSNTIDGHRRGVEVADAEATLVNNLVTFNERSGIRVTGTSIVDLNFNDVYNPDSTQGDYEDLADATGQQGNISRDPRYFNRASRQYQLRSGSAAVDAGTSDSAPVTDFLDNPRFDDPLVPNLGGGIDRFYDIGALERQEISSSDIDLAAVSIAGPAMGLQDEEITVTYTTTNMGSATAIAPWHEGFYLSDDNIWSPDDVFLGESEQVDDLGPGQSYTASANVTLPAALPGPHYLVLRTDWDNFVFEGANEGNNTEAAVSTIATDLPALTLGSPAAGQLAATGDVMYFKVAAPAGADLLVELDGPDDGTELELYASFGRLPSRQSFDQRGIRVNTADQAVSFANTRAGDYYVLVNGADLEDITDFSVTASLEGFSLSGVSPSQGTVDGQVTLALSGAQFDASLAARLVDSSGAMLDPVAMYFTDSGLIHATFDLAGSGLGPADVQIVDGGTVTAQLPDAFDIVDGQAGRLVTDLVVAGRVRFGRDFDVIVEYANEGDADLLAPVIRVSSTDFVSLRLDPDAEEGADDVTVVGVNPFGPAGILPPGARGQIVIHGHADTVGDSEFSLTVGQYDQTAIDWEMVEDLVRPADVDAGLWDQIFDQIEANVGTTWMDFSAAVSRDATLLPPSLGLNYSLRDVFQLEVDRAFAALDTAAAGQVHLYEGGHPLADAEVRLISDTGEVSSGISLTDGSFLIPVEPGQYDVEVIRHFIDGATALTVPVAGVKNVELIVAPGGEISGGVALAPGGQPLRDVLVVATSDDDVFAASTDDLGRYTLDGLPVGTYEVTAGGESHVVSAPIEIEITADDPLKMAGFAIIEGGTISGVVSGPGGPVAGAVVAAFNDEGQGSSSTTEDDGSYRVTALPGGILTVVASADGLVRGETTGVALAAGEDLVGIDINLAEAGSLAGNVSLFAGGPGEFAFLGLSGPGGDFTGQADENGDYSFTEIPPGDYTLSFVGIRYMSAETNVTITAGSQTDADLQTAPLGIVSGTVTNSSSGGPLERVVVYAEDDQGRFFSTVTDGTGSYQLEGFDVNTTVDVILGDEFSPGHDRVTVGFDYNTTQHTVDLTTAVEGTVSGHVFEPDGTTPLVGVPVSLVAGDEIIVTAASDSLGHYSFVVTATGTYDLVTLGGGFHFPRINNVAVGGGSDVTDLDFTAGSETIQGTVVDAAGQPVAEANVSIVPDGFPIDIPAALLTTTTAADGTYNFTGGVPGDFDVYILKPGFAQTSVPVTVNAGVAAMADATLLAGRAIMGTVTDSASTNPVEGVTVVVVGRDDPTIRFSTATDAAGEYEFDQLPAGNYALIYREESHQTGTIELSLTGTTAIVNAVLAAPNTQVSGVVESDGVPVPGAIVKATDTNGNVLATAATSDDGSYMLTALPAGTYDISLASIGFLTSAPVNVVLSPGGNLADVDLTAMHSALSDPDATAEPDDVNFDWLSDYKLPARPDLQAELDALTAEEVSANCTDRISHAEDLIDSAFKLRIASALHYHEVDEALHTAHSSLVASLGNLKSTEKYWNKTMPEEYGEFFLAALRLYNQLGISSNFDRDEFASALREGDLNAVLVELELLQLVTSTKKDAVFFSLANSRAAKDYKNSLDQVLKFGESLRSAVENVVVQFLLNKEYNNAITKARQAINSVKECTSNCGAEAPEPSPQNVRATASPTVCQAPAQTEQPPGKPPVMPQPATTTQPGSRQTNHAVVSVRTSLDPNDKIGPDGFGPEEFIQPGVLPYEIQFENDPELGATLPAQEVFITDVLVDDLDLATVEFVSFGFNNFDFDVPAGLSQYETTIDLRPDGIDLLVPVTLDVDSDTRILSATFRSLDPITLDLPDDIDAGFLPVNDKMLHNGEGFIRYRVRPQDGLPTGTEFRNQASIVFDVNEPVLTPETLHTLDAAGPTSGVDPLSATMLTTSFPVQWSGDDDAAGSGIRDYNVYVSVDGGDFELWQRNTAATQARYVGQRGRSYAFYSLANDNVGHAEPAKAAAESQTTVDANAMNVLLVNSTLDTPDANPGDGIVDDGSGNATLRAAIQEANALANQDGMPDVIHFDIPGSGPHVIQPGSPLPDLRDVVVIDGTSEPDFDAGSGNPVVEIDGSLAGLGASGLTVVNGADGSTIRGLAINQFDANGIFVSRRDNVSIEGNYLGTDTSGMVDLGNGEAGVYIINGQNNSVRDNLISGNDKGVLIEGSQSTGNVIATNVIGTNADGTDTLSNHRPTANIDIAGAPGNMVGGPGGAGNVIGGGKVGVSIRGATATGNVIQGNFIGNNGAGTAVANTRGVEIKTDASGNSIGGAGDTANVISGNTKGIEVNRADGNSIRGNMIGVNQAGDAPLENVRGVLVRNSANNQIGGGGSSANVISGNVRQGVRILLGDSTGNVVIGNFIGTDAAGNAGIANRNGVVISPGADGNTVGGMTAAERNVISGNTRAGVVLQANNNLVVGNFIGTDATGTAAVGNETGVLIDDTTGNTIGGAFGSSGGNVISGNAEAGVRVTRDGATGNTVTGNAIGTDPTGMTAVGNKHGVLIESAANTVGGGTANDGNVISGNTQNGVYLIGAAATGNLIQNNRIGINIDGTAALANERSGVLIEEAPGNTIGGNGTGNAIGGNTLQGIRIAGAGATGNLVQGNSIGLDGLTMTAVANRDGIRIADDASGNTIGGADGLANEIAQNTRIGIYISDGASNTVTQNSIHDNGTLGISLGALGETPNDDDDGDTGANNLQNSPVIQRVELVGASLEVTFLTNSAAGNSNYGVSGLSIEFFIADSDDEEGQTFLSQVFYDAPINVVTLTIPAGSAGLGTKIVATATDDDGNTSEFSAAVAVDEHVADSLFEELGG